MGQIYFRQFYTPLVEHCLRVVIAEKKPFGLRQDWIDFATKWVENLSDSDRNFVTFVFSKEYFNSYEGLSCYEPYESYLLKHRRLFELERDFAVKGGLISEEEAVLKDYTLKGGRYGSHR